MPTYEVDIEGKTFEVNSDTELSDTEVTQAAQSGSNESPLGKEGYFPAVGRRVNEAASAFTDLPKNLGGIITGGDEGRLPALFKSLQGVAAPYSILTAPVGGAGEAIAQSAGANEGWARLAGDITEGVGTLGLGLLAKAGKLGSYGLQLAKVLGVGRGEQTLNEILKHDPQMRFALGRDLKATENPLEELARTSSSMEDLAMSLKSPELARNFLEQRKVKQEVWGEWAKSGQIIDEVPEAASFSPGELLAFQPTPKKDIGIFSTIGTPTNLAARIHPSGGNVAYEMALSEMNLKAATGSRNARDSAALSGMTDKQNNQAVWARETLSAEQIATNRNISPEVKRVLKYIDDKYEVDRQIIIPRERALLHDRLLGQYEKAAKKAGDVVDDGTIETKAAQKASEVIPDDWGLEKYLTHIFSGQYKIRDPKGNIVGTARNELEAKLTLRDLALEESDNLNLTGYSVSKQTYFDSDLLSSYKGRVGRTLDSIAKGGEFTPEKIAAAAAGDFKASGDVKFWGSLISRQGNSSGYNKDLITIFQAYNRNFERYMQLSDLSSKVAPTIAELGHTGYSGLAGMLEHSIQRLWGKSSAVSQYFDNTMQGIPVINKLITPQALERWTSGLKTGIVATHLATSPRYHALNSVQTLATLWPILHGNEGREGLRLLNSPAGKTLLEAHNITALGGRIENMSKGQGPIEAFNQNLSFLTMYNKARKLGLNDEQAGTYGKLRGNLYTQFAALTTDVPMAFSKIDPMGIMTMFQRFPVKQAELLIDAIKDRNFPAAAKFLGVNLVLGGFKAATFGQAGWLTYKLYKDIEKEYGKPLADAFHSGLPGVLLGVDVANSVMLYNPPFGESWQEKVGNIAGGIPGALVSSALGAYAQSASPEPEGSKRVFNAMMDRVPVLKQLDALRRIFTQDYEFKDPLGRLRFKGDVSDAIKQLMGAKQFEAGLDQTFSSALLEVVDSRNQVINYAASRYGQAKLSGIELGADMQKSVEDEVHHWNELWPDYPISGSDIMDRSQSRMLQATQNLRQRILKSAPKAVRSAEVFATPEVMIPGGG